MDTAVARCRSSNSLFITQLVQLVRSEGGEWKASFASLASHCDALNEAFELTAVTVAGNITITAAGATNRSFRESTRENGKSERKAAFRTHKDPCSEGALSPVKDGLEMDGSSIAQVYQKLAVGDVSRVAEVAFEPHLMDDSVQQKAVCVCGREGSVSLAKCAVQ